jgi:prolyl oligopeptidase
VDTYSRVRVIDQAGGSCGHLPLPAAGTVGELPFSWMSLPPWAEEFVFAFCTLDTSWAIYRHRPGDPDADPLTAAAIRIEGAIVEDHWARSPDGTRIPYHTVRLATTDTSRPVPALIFAYGGFNHSFPPSFPGAMAAFIEAGGIFVHAHLRGGAEHGRAWREAGRHHHKQNTYDDLYAVAEDLIARGVTEKRMLAVTGRSNGGLTAGVAVTQRPDLWQAAIPIVPMLDLIGGLRDPFTAAATRIDRGNPGDPGDVRRLAGYSPYQGIRPGTVYPAIFVSAAAADMRCPPWHARKWGARMQAAQAGDAPILIHIWEGAGHGAATPGDIAMEENTEWLSFVMRQLNLTPP